MRKTVKGMWTFLAAAAFTAGLSMASLASTGWVKEGDDWYYLDSDGAMLTDEDAWQEGLYYCDPDNGGRLVVSSWKYLTAENDEDEDREGDGYWFYFQSTGKKVVDQDSKRINGRKYRLDEYGAAQFEWYADPCLASDSGASSLYYNSEDSCWLATGWFKTYPDEDIDPGDYEEDEQYWYYADSDGELYTAVIKRTRMCTCTTSVTPPRKGPWRPEPAPWKSTGKTITTSSPHRAAKRAQASMKSMTTAYIYRAAA